VLKPFRLLKNLLSTNGLIKSQGSLEGFNMNRQ
jgi:hypothetical protein